MQLVLICLPVSCTKIYKAHFRLSKINNAISQPCAATESKTCCVLYDDFTSTNHVPQCKKKTTSKDFVSSRTTDNQEPHVTSRVFPGARFISLKSSSSAVKLVSSSLATERKPRLCQCRWSLFRRNITFCLRDVGLVWA